VKDLWNVLRSAKLPVYVNVIKDANGTFYIQICGLNVLVVTILKSA